MAEDGMEVAECDERLPRTRADSLDGSRRG